MFGTICKWFEKLCCCKRYQPRKPLHNSLDRNGKMPTMHVVINPDKQSQARAPRERGERHHRRRRRHKHHLKEGNRSKGSTKYPGLLSNAILLTESRSQPKYPERVERLPTTSLLHHSSMPLPIKPQTRILPAGQACSSLSHPCKGHDQHQHSSRSVHITINLLNRHESNEGRCSVYQLPATSPLRNPPVTQRPAENSDSRSYADPQIFLSGAALSSLPLSNTCCEQSPHTLSLVSPSDSSKASSHGAQQRKRRNSSELSTNEIWSHNLQNKTTYSPSSSTVTISSVPSIVNRTLPNEEIDPGKAVKQPGTLKSKLAGTKMRSRNRSIPSVSSSVSLGPPEIASLQGPLKRAPSPAREDAAPPLSNSAASSTVCSLRPASCCNMDACRNSRTPSSVEGESRPVFSERHDFAWDGKAALHKSASVGPSSKFLQPTVETVTDSSVGPIKKAQPVYSHRDQNHARLLNTQLSAFNITHPVGYFEQPESSNCWATNLEDFNCTPKKSPENSKPTIKVIQSHVVPVGANGIQFADPFTDFNSNKLLSSSITNVSPTNRTGKRTRKYEGNKRIRERSRSGPFRFEASPCTSSPPTPVSTTADCTINVESVRQRIEAWASVTYPPFSPVPPPHFLARPVSPLIPNHPRTQINPRAATVDLPGTIDIINPIQYRQLRLWV